MIFKEALKVFIFLCLGLLISRYNASSPQRGLHDERHKESKPSEDILDIPLMSPMTCLELLCREMMSGSQLLEKNVKGEYSFEDKLSKLSKHEPFRCERSAEEFSEDKMLVKELYEIQRVLQDNSFGEKLLEELSKDKTSEQLNERVAAHVSDTTKAKHFEQHTEDITSEGVSQGTTTEDLSENETFENIFSSLNSEDSSAGQNSEEHVTEGNEYENKTVNDKNKSKEIWTELIIAFVILCLIVLGLIMKIVYISKTLQGQVNREANENTLQTLELSSLGSERTPPPGYFPPSYPPSEGTPSEGTLSVSTQSSQTQISAPESSETLELNRREAIRRRFFSWWPFQRRLPLQAFELTQTSGTSRSSRPSFNPSDRPPHALQNQEAVTEGRRSSQGYQTSRMDFKIPHSFSNMSSKSHRSDPPSYSGLSPAHESSNVLEAGPSRQVPITERGFHPQQLPDDSSSDSIPSTPQFRHKQESVEESTPTHEHTPSSKQTNQSTSCVVPGRELQETGSLLASKSLPEFLQSPQRQYCGEDKHFPLKQPHQKANCIYRRHTL